jgi:hypothetical protein
MIDNNTRERFAAVHLAGSLEAAVYETLAGVPSLAWTRAELATQLHADVALVHVALRQFAAAGNRRRVRGRRRQPVPVAIADAVPRRPAIR